MRQSGARGTRRLGTSLHPDTRKTRRGLAGTSAAARRTAHPPRHRRTGGRVLPCRWRSLGIPGWKDGPTLSARCLALQRGTGLGAPSGSAAPVCRWRLARAGGSDCRLPPGGRRRLPGRQAGFGRPPGILRRHPSTRSQASLMDDRGHPACASCDAAVRRLAGRMGAAEWRGAPGRSLTGGVVDETAMRGVWGHLGGEEGPR